MMDAMEAILSRRSVRRYLDKEISDDLIRKLLEAAMAAPSAHNEKPWHFVVIRDRTILEAIPKVHPYSKMLNQSPAAILVCGDHKLEKDPQAGYWVQDCSAATENILLAAHAMGLGACWLGIHPRQQRKDGIRNLCGLPGHVEAFSVIALGWPDEDKLPSDRYNEKRIHQDRW